MTNANWQVNEVNIVVKCSIIFSIRKYNIYRLLEDLNFRDRESVKAFHNNVYLIILCQQSAFFRTLKNFFVLVEMTFGQVVASCSLPKWQLSCKTDFLCTL